MMQRRISIADEEIAAHIAEANVRRESRYPRCDCKGNKQLAKKWKEDAKANICGFIKGQFGKEPRLLDTVDRRAMKRDCVEFIPKDKMKMLNGMKPGRQPATFWADFCESTHKYDTLSPDKALKLFKAMFPAKNSKAKTLGDIVFTEGQRKRVMADALLMVRLDIDTRRELGLTHRIRREHEKTKNLAQLSTKMSLQEAERFIIAGLNAHTKGTAYFDNTTGRIVVTKRPRDRWLEIANKLGSKLPQVFLEKYSDELVKRKAGRKKKVIDPNAPIVSKKKPKKKQKKLIPVKRKPVYIEPEDDTEEDTSFDVDVAELEKKPVPVPGKITTQERLNQFINNVMKKHDSTYGLSTEIRHWSNPEWSMVDVYRDSIAPDLLEKYAPQIEQAKRVLGVRSGGAYASIRDNRQLCVAHVVTAWMCGELT